MFDSITHESLPNGDTLAHYRAGTGNGDFGYVAFHDGGWRRTISAVLFHDGVKRTLKVSYAKLRLGGASISDIAEPYY